MTINIALVTSEAFVLGCDSISSETDFFLRPLNCIETDAEGNFVLDADGRATARFTLDQIQQVVTNSFGNVTKMFSISRGGVEAAAVTSGLASIGGKTISALAEEFLLLPTPGETLAQVAAAFLAFVREQYLLAFGAAIPLKFQPALEFLIGGFESASRFPAAYRVRVKENTCVAVYEGGSTGLTWAAQSDGVERLIFGIDSQLKSQITFELNKALDDFYEASKLNAMRMLEELMTAAGLDELPAGVNTEFVGKPAVELPFKNCQLDIDFANLPLQDAVDFVSYLVNLQSGRAKFARGVATVGGRTHIGVITRNNKLRMLNEPELVHRNPGYSHDQ
ncbi:hypothetical protein [Paraburkholderia sp. MM5477-R1]|uniref:hypothetical protein n=1 Tax=Paraburkholderia sp. MM5477-R1 TaxID=2991062 RepID=UPI003D2297D0